MFDDSAEGINFWPAFTDSMLAVVLVLLLVIGAVYLATGQQTKQAQDCESQFAASLQAHKQDKQSVWIVAGKNGATKITLKQDENDRLILHLTFNEAALGFRECEDQLSAAGEDILSQVARQVRKQVRSIVEIQILGHADWQRPTDCRFPDNLHLASARADRVFDFLQAHQVSPLDVAMSAVSYGEFFPADRVTGEPYSQKQWGDANANAAMMQRNRRVEMILRYNTKVHHGCE